MSAKWKRNGVGAESVKENQEKTTSADLLHRALSWVVDEKMFAHLTPHGNTTWVASQLVVLAVLWVGSGKNTLTGALDHAKQLAFHMFGEVALTTYQGLTNALVKWSGTLLPLIWTQLHVRMEQVGVPLVRVNPIAIAAQRNGSKRVSHVEREHHLIVGERA